MIPEGIDAMLVRYFSGRLGEQERSAFEAWIAEDPARQEEVERLRALWEASAAVQSPNRAHTEAALARVKDEARGRRVRAFGSIGAPARRTVTYLWRAAAAVILLVGGGVLWRTLGSAPRDAPDATPMWTYTTARGQRAVLRLPDSSRVMLNTESTVEVPASFGRRTREVFLRGEAYFEVTHNPDRPFRVHGGPAVTHVLGTKFGVRARPGEVRVQVAVAEGRVTLRRDVDSAVVGAGVVLGRGDVARMRTDGETEVARAVDVSRLLSWTEGRLAFERALVPDVLAELTRWYDRDFVLADSSLAVSRLTTSLRGETLGEAIAVLEAALGVRARVVGKTVILRRER